MYYLEKCGKFVGVEDFHLTSSFVIQEQHGEFVGIEGCYLTCLLEETSLRDFICNVCRVFVTNVNAGN